ALRKCTCVRCLAGAAAQDTEEGLDVAVGADVPVAVEVSAVAGCTAAAAQAGKEGLDIGVGSDIPVVVEVGAAAVPGPSYGQGHGAAGDREARVAYHDVIVPLVGGKGWVDGQVGGHGTADGAAL